MRPIWERLWLFAWRPEKTHHSSADRTAQRFRHFGLLTAQETYAVPRLVAQLPDRLTLSQSRFLTSLPADLHDRLDADLEPVLLTRRQFLFHNGEALTHVYFPTGCLISLVVELENGNMVEATTVGTDGFVGMGAYLGVGRAEATAMIQIEGEALRMPVEAFSRHLEDPRLRSVVGRFTYKTLQTFAQSAACMAFHPVQERLARWLLIVKDVTDSEEFLLTHEFIAVMLGVHRPTVTITLRILESAGLIEHRRGRIRIVDAPALAEAACECYRARIKMTA